MRLARTTLTALLALTTLAGCTASGSTGGDQPPSGAATPTTPASDTPGTSEVVTPPAESFVAKAWAGVDPCALITPDDLLADFGQVDGPGQPEEGGCTYTGGDTGVVLLGFMPLSEMQPDPELGNPIVEESPLPGNTGQVVCYDTDTLCTASIQIDAEMAFHVIVGHETLGADLRKAAAIRIVLLAFDRLPPA